MNESLLKVENIETYYGPIMAIRGVSFEVKKGSIVTILGSNGAGKTTILKTISGAIDPRKGKITLNGKEIQKKDPDKILKLGMSHSPEGREVFPYCSVLENLQMGAFTRNDEKEINIDLEQVFNYFPILKERMNQPAGLLSGGEQQMLCISRSLMSRPSIMLLDEPSLGLSPKLVKEIFKIIVRINKELKTTILLVEQNANIALSNSDFGYVLELGRIVMEGDSAELLDKEDIKEFYLGQQDAGIRGEKRWKKKKMWR
jgi:branched-chain amino acid transport system ATP-binding protein